jgi:erythromycin esterase-like protein
MRYHQERRKILSSYDKTRAASWNIRDEHMVSTIDRLLKFHGTESKEVVVWEHNTHIEILAPQTWHRRDGKCRPIIERKIHHRRVIAVGFGSYQGSVLLRARRCMRKLKYKAMEGSWEHLFHIASNSQDRLLLCILFVKNNVCQTISLIARLVSFIIGTRKVW